MHSFGVRPRARLQTSLTSPIPSQRLRRRCRRVDTTGDIVCECPTLVAPLQFDRLSLRIRTMISVASVSFRK
jgi:hypothetical protein